MSMSTSGRNWVNTPMLTVQPGFRYLGDQYRTYVPGFLFDTSETSSQKSLETRLATVGKREE